ncbi:hypothetical protein [Clostridium ganghwense]|uniref:hypothetical protein n=1 Tax=Clostridium ganghwense TaxID=312089 RepID=UPI003AEF5C35
MVAAFFAVEKYINTEAVIYAYLDPKHLITDSIGPFDNYHTIGKFKPNGASKRIIRQSGIFTVHFPATLELDKDKGKNCKLEKIIIDKKYRKELLFDLSFYGINKASMFPDLEGLCKHVNWHMENINYWTSKQIENFVAADSEN